ncbi:Histidine kinase [Purpureocillium takamizusanense]|uniref:histidine kinase n=1 Tax=Purpureocillium takamizusanense TaxID=2060973 RepID=A0A9Q8VFC1_9HYPO|nr:Histidine kinase [Purpureocillium takamizusanense]UNI23271.1 Histidine kinase [Purpureocillium takamizusanense]
MSEIVDYSPVPTLVVSPSYRVERASAGLFKAWRWSREQVVGEDLFAALYRGSPTERFDRIPLAFAIERAVKSRALRLCHAAYTDADGVAWTARIIPIHKDDDRPLWLVFEWEKAEVHITAADGGIRQSWLSIDEASRILVEAVKDYAIFLLDTRGNVMTWNIGAELNKGYTKDEIIGKHFSIFYGEEDLQSHKPERELEICLREGRVEDEGWRYRKDGSRFWANVIITAVYRNDIHVGFGKVTRNLTERKEAEMRVIAACEESTKLKNDFLANISHEIRTPMHGMLSACSLLLDSDLTEEQLETANIIEESGRVLLQVINDILDYSKLAAGSFSITNDRFNVAHLVTSVVRSFQTTVQPGVSLRTDLATDLPKWAGGDALRFRQILENIVGNAGKFTERGYIIVRVSRAAQDATTDTIVTEVVDTGHGVGDESEIKLFEPFTQLDTTYQKRRQGTGLGLSIAKSLVQLMGGDIGYKPNPEESGSIFWFTVKLRRVDGLQHSNAPHEREPLRQQNLQGPEVNAPLASLRRIAAQTRILVAEDNIINQKVLVGVLHAFGLQNITVVSNGAEAVSALAASPDAFDLCLMDISMPVMNGYEATVQIRNSGSRIPIIAMTAYALKGDMERCLEKGVNDYLAKPVNRQLLMHKLLKWLPKSGDGDDGVFHGCHKDAQKPPNGVLRHA